MIPAILRCLCRATMLAQLPAFGQARTVVVLGTAPAGGGFELYAEAVAKTVAETDAPLAVETRAPSGCAPGPSSGGRLACL